MTDRQALFIQFYLGEAKLNATAAARLAGYADPEKEGWRVRQDPEVQAEISGRFAEYGMSADEVIAELSDIARNSKIAPLMDAKVYSRPTFNLANKDGELKPEMRFVRKVTIGNDSISVEVYDRLSALEKMGRVHALFVDRTKVEGMVTLGPAMDLTKLSEEELEQLDSLIGKATDEGASTDGEGTQASS
jgi:hypothetical protein